MVAVARYLVATAIAAGRYRLNGWDNPGVLTTVPYSMIYQHQGEHSFRYRYSTQSYTWIMSASGNYLGIFPRRRLWYDQAPGCLEVGFRAMLTIMSCPVEMPHSTPPA